MKAAPTDLQSVLVDRLSILPFSSLERNRTSQLVSQIATYFYQAPYLKLDSRQHRVSGYRLRNLPVLHGNHIKGYYPPTDLPVSHGLTKSMMPFVETRLSAAPATFTETILREYSTSRLL